MSEKMFNLKKIRYEKCVCCDQDTAFDSGEDFEFINDKTKQKIKKFICDSCLETIINSDKAEEYY